jgi:hypothetical protein
MRDLSRSNGNADEEGREGEGERNANGESLSWRSSSKGDAGLKGGLGELEAEVEREIKESERLGRRAFVIGVGVRGERKVEGVGVVGDRYAFVEMERGVGVGRGGGAGANREGVEWFAREGEKADMEVGRVVKRNEGGWE